MITGQGIPGVPDDLEKVPEDLHQVPMDLAPVRAPAQAATAPVADAAPTLGDDAKAMQAMMAENKAQTIEMLGQAEEARMDMLRKAIPQSTTEGLSQALTAAKDNIMGVLHPDLTVPADPNAIPKAIVDTMKKGFGSMVSQGAEIPSEADIAASIPPEQQGAYLQALKQEQAQKASISQAVGDVVMAPITAFSIPQRLLVGNAIKNRYPELMERVRIENERNGTPDWERALDEFAPPLYLGSDVVKPAIQKYMDSMNPDHSAILGAFGSVLAAAGSVAADVVSDPLFYFSFLQEKKLATVIKDEATGAKVLSIPTPEGKPIFLDTDGNLHGIIQPSAEQAKKLSTLEIGAGPIKVTVNSDKVNKALQLFNYDFENSRVGKLISGFATNTTNRDFNTARNIRSIEASSGHMFADDIADMAKDATQGNLSESVSRYASMYMEHGPEGADKLASRMGLKLNDADKTAAQNLGDTMAQWREWGRNVHQQMTGDVLPVFQPATMEQQAAALKDPKVRRLYDAVPEDLKPLLFSDNATVGRTLNPDYIKEANAMGVELDMERRKLQSLQGEAPTMKIIADSQKERAKLSTWAYNALVQDQFPQLKNSYFDPDIVRSTQKQVQDLITTAANRKFVDSIQTMGKTPNEWRESIETAQQMVAERGRMNVDPEVYRISKIDPASLQELKPSTFRSINESGRGTMPTWGGAFDGVKQPDLRFEPTVRAALDAEFSPIKLNGLQKALAWVNNTTDKAALATPRRLFPQLQESIIAGLAGGMHPADLIKTLAARIKPDAAYEAFHAAGLEKSLSGSMDSLRGTILTPKMVTDPAINAGWNNYLQDLHAISKAGAVESTFGDMMKKGTANIAKAGVSAPADVVRFIAADNPIARRMRDVVNGLESIPKEALFRTRLRMGDNVFDAAANTSRAMMDFRWTSEGVKKNLQPYARFANYFVKNAERLPFLIAKSPWLPNLTDEHRGALRRAIERHQDWEPGALQNLQNNLGPFPTAPVFGSFLPGWDSVLDKNDHVQSYLNNLIYGLLGRADTMDPNSYVHGALQKSREGYQALFSLPSSVGAAQEFFSSPIREFWGGEPQERGIGRMMNPAARAAVLALSGYDTATGEKIPLDNTEERARARLEAMYAATDMVRSPNFWNVAHAAVDATVRAHARSLNGFLEDPSFQDVMKFLGASTKNKETSEMNKLRVSDSVLKSLVTMGTLGVVQMSQPDVQFQMHMRAMLAQRKDLEGSMRKAGIQGDKPKMERLKGDMFRLRDKVQRAVDLKQAYDASVVALKKSPSLQGELEQLGTGAMFNPQFGQQPEQSGLEPGDDHPTPPEGGQNEEK